MFLRGTAYTVGVAMPITVGAFILAEDLIRTWVGDALIDATNPTRLFLLYLPFAASHIVGATMVVALGKVRFILITSIVNLAISVGLSIALVGSLEIEGVIIGTLAGQILTWPALLWFFLREFDVGLREWAARILVPSVPGFSGPGNHRARDSLGGRPLGQPARGRAPATALDRDRHRRLHPGGAVPRAAPRAGHLRPGRARTAPAA